MRCHLCHEPCIKPMTRMRRWLNIIAHLPYDVSYMDNDDVTFTWSNSAFILACDLHHAGKGQLVRKAAVEVLHKHARVRSQERYLKILNDINRLMFAHEKSIELDPRETSMIDIGVILWLLPVVRRWRLVREAVAVCAMATRREQWWLAFAECAFRPGAAAVNAAAEKFEALALVDCT